MLESSPGRNFSYLYENEKSSLALRDGWFDSGLDFIVIVYAAFHLFAPSYAALISLFDCYFYLSRQRILFAHGILDIIRDEEFHALPLDYPQWRVECNTHILSPLNIWQNVLLSLMMSDGDWKCC